MLILVIEDGLTMQHNHNQLWKEIPAKFFPIFMDRYNWEKYELILFKNDNSVLFYGQHCKLNRYTYRFLMNILNQNGKNINANKLMEQIGSKCKEELRQKLSYRIKSKIKNKLKKNWKGYLPSYTLVEWMVLDFSYENNEHWTIFPDGSRHYQTQYCDFETVFDMLIAVKDGFFSTSFRKK